VPGATIDHVVSLTIFIAALLLFMSLFSQNLQAAILYQRNRQVAIKATELLDSISLNPGYPIDWGKTNSTPTCFGLQDTNARGYTLSPFSLMRLTSFSGNPVQLHSTGVWYSNVSMGYGGYLLVPFSNCVNYTTAAGLLGINGSYAFQLTITPILTVSITELNAANPLRIKVTVQGPGLPLSDAYLKYNLVVATKVSGETPGFQIFSGTNRTQTDGSAILGFSITGFDSQSAYAIIVNAHLGGLFGVGFRDRVSPNVSEIGEVMPFVESFEEGKIILVHSNDVHDTPSPSALHYNATFLVLSPDFEFHTVGLGEGTVTGEVVYGQANQKKGNVTIPTSDPGVLIVTYRKGNDLGISLLPWGIGSLGVSLAYGENPSNRDWVATDVRQVMIAGVSYQAKIAVWSLAGFQVWTPIWRP
jgi:hypothetical protein